jgi:hypothetical protein
MGLRTVLVAMLVLALGCTSDGDNAAGRAKGTPKETSTSSRGAEALDVDALVQGLEAAGTDVARGRVLAGGPFDFPGESLCVDQEPLRVWEFHDPKLRLAASSTISKDGSHVRNAIVEWVGPAHFFAQGRLIVLYLGTDDELQATLTAILGPTLSPEAPQREVTVQASTECDDGRP